MCVCTPGGQTLIMGLQPHETLTYLEMVPLFVAIKEKYLWDVEESY